MAITTPSYERRQVLWLLWIVLPGTAALTWWLAGAVQAEPRAQLAVAAVAASELLVLAGLGRFVVRVQGDTLHWRFGYLGWPHWQLPLADIRTVEQARCTWVEGWGIRRTKEGMLYNARGSGAVRLTLKDGRRLRLGSDEPDRLAAFIAARLT